jgi:hypothetical protein
LKTGLIVAIGGAALLGLVVVLASRKQTPGTVTLSASAPGSIYNAGVAAGTAQQQQTTEAQAVGGVTSILASIFGASKTSGVLPGTSSGLSSAPSYSGGTQLQTANAVSPTPATATIPLINTADNSLLTAPSLIATPVDDDIDDLGLVNPSVISDESLSEIVPDADVDVGDDASYSFA